MIEVKNLTKKYGGLTALDDVSFTINDGEIVGFLGPNGAGKTTTMNIMTGCLSSNKGSVTISGFDIYEEPDNAKKNIGYLPETPPLYVDMTVEEYLNFVYELKKCKINRKTHISEICKITKIDHVYKRVIKHLSKGYRQRVGIAQALITNPDIIILDEPTVGLDPNQIIETRDLIKRLGKSHTVIFSSHILSEVQAVCNRVLVINNGKLVADDTPGNLSKNVNVELKLTLRAVGPEKLIREILNGINDINSIRELGRKEEGAFDFEVEVEEGKDVRKDIFFRFAERQCPIVMIKSAELTLEEIFIHLTKEGGKK